MTTAHRRTSGHAAIGGQRASGAPGRIVVVGSINADLIAHVERHPRPGETLHGGGGRIQPGGKGANQAVAAALQGGDVAMVGAVGTDAHADAALAMLRASEVDLAAVRAVEGPTGLAIVTVAADGENAIVVIPGANGTVGAEHVQDAHALVADAEVVVLQGEIPREGIEAAARTATGRVVLNPAPVLELARDVLELADPLVVNEHEAALVLDMVGRPETTPTPDALVEALLQMGVRSVVLTLGAEGAFVADADGIERVPAASVRAVDTTGAGDAFIGALSVGLASGRGLVDAARQGARVAAFAVQRVGAQPSFPGVGDVLPDLA
ncbi:MAG: ribokinase [Brachybacterium sp.]|nr:ribokinase [Brachybacterium sp.]